MNIASIDIGSNTVLLLIAEINIGTQGLRTILDEYRIPRISKNLKPGEPIGEDGINMLFSVLKEYNNLIHRYGCGKILVTGTNPFRISSNSNEIVNKIKEEFNFEINILDGSEEAYLSYLGAVPLENSGMKNLVIDIGGGSTELCYGIKNKLFFKKSYLAGAVSGYELFFSDHRNENSVKNYIEHLRNIFSDKEILQLKPDNSYAVAGTPTTAACLILGLAEFRHELVNDFKLLRKDLTSLINVFMEQDPHEILIKYGNIVKGREDILLTGMIILVYLMDLFHLDFITVSTRGLRYGTIIKEFNLFQGRVF